MERSPASQEVDQGGEQRNKYRFHTGNATRAQTEKSTKSMGMEFLVGTGAQTSIAVEARAIRAYDRVLNNRLPVFDLEKLYIPPRLNDTQVLSAYYPVPNPDFRDYEVKLPGRRYCPVQPGQPRK